MRREQFLLLDRFIGGVLEDGRALHKIFDEYISLRAIDSIHLQHRSRNHDILIFAEEQMELLEVRRLRP